MKDHSLSKAWHLASTHTRSLILIWLTGLVIRLGCYAIDNLGSEIMPHVLEKAWSFLWLVGFLILNMMAMASSTYLIKEQVIDNNPMTFSQTFNAYFLWFKDHWKDCWKPYLIWGFLMQGLAILVFLFIFTIVLLSVVGADSMANNAGQLYTSTEALLRSSFGSMAFLMFFLVCLSALYALMSNAFAYRAYYGISAAWQGKVVKTGVFGRCVKLAVWPMLAVLLFFFAGSALFVLGIQTNNFYFSFLFGLVILALAVILMILMILYQYVVITKVLLDLDNPTLAADQFGASAMPEIPYESSGFPEKEEPYSSAVSLPDLPNAGSKALDPANRNEERSQESQELQDNPQLESRDTAEKFQNDKPSVRKIEPLHTFNPYAAKNQHKNQNGEQNQAGYNDSTPPALPPEDSDQ